MWPAILTLTVLALAAGLGLGFAARKLPANRSELVERVNDLLPQTQCAQCGYPGCRPYAAAIVEDGAAINLCPPGGNDTVQRLADLLGRNESPPGPPRQRSRSSTSCCASAALTAAPPARSTPLSAPTSSCTPLSSRNARAASSAWPRVPSIA
jgi:RnfABCDGE-type electron transport complex B subunit